MQLSFENQISAPYCFPRLSNHIKMSRLDKVLSLVAPYLAIDLKTAVAFQTWLDEDGIQADTAKLWSRVILFGFHYIRQSIPDYLGAPFPESLYLRQLAKFQDFPSCPRTFIEIIETTGGQLSGLLPRLFPLPQISSTSTILRTLPRNFPFYSHSLYDELVSAIKRESIDDWIRLLGATHDLVCGRERERREDKEMTASGRFEMLVEELEGTDWSVVEVCVWGEGVWGTDESGFLSFADRNLPRFRFQ